ncbi:DUF6114 domain-containing protein [Robertmurraya kyonggiensis]|uniref:Uncharacterized protein n=1 Tax=Robertmurraya kyonggiensis TaxID=1037680 RepID=A0A4U1DAP1_9BACI|nr:DUF6114 domain-containing protein [Robertmurraya kyonggiensis]TKC19534.1 hypothetical protein FA727_08335 [Robertmurraya kyonggiensis]
MDRKERRRQKKEEKWKKKTQNVAQSGKFKQWRNKRPFWGATLTILAALIILYIPLQLYAIAFIPGSLVFIGFLFSGILLIIGIFSFIYPQFSSIFGVLTIFLSVLSIMGALGGFIIGTIIGIIAGALCIAWDKEEVAIPEKLPSEKDDSQYSIQA